MRGPAGEVDVLKSSAGPAFTACLGPMLTRPFSSKFLENLSPPCREIRLKRSKFSDRNTLQELGFGECSCPKIQKAKSLR